MPETDFEATIKGKHADPKVAEDMLRQFARRLKQSGASIQEADIRQQGVTKSVKADAEEPG